MCGRWFGQPAGLARLRVKVSARCARARPATTSNWRGPFTGPFRVSGPSGDGEAISAAENLGAIRRNDFATHCKKSQSVRRLVNRDRVLALDQVVERDVELGRRLSLDDVCKRSSSLPLRGRIGWDRTAASSLPGGRRKSEVWTGVWTFRAFAARRRTWAMEECGLPHDLGGRNGRYWARTSDPQLVESGEPSRSGPKRPVYAGSAGPTGQNDPPVSRIR
jgi:hypothetical protein